MLRLRELTPGLDGSVVLRYHSVPYLRARPPSRLNRNTGKTTRFRSFVCGHLPGRATSSSSFISRSGVSRQRVRQEPIFLVGPDAFPEGLRRGHFLHGRGKPCQRSTPTDGESCRLERLSGRTFWLLWATIILISAAFYYEKAADHRSAFVRWRPQVLQFWSGREHLRQDALPEPADHADLTLSAHGAADGRRRNVLVCDQGCYDDGRLADVLRDRAAAGTIVPADVPLVDPAPQSSADPGRSSSRQQQSPDLVPGGVDVLRLAQGVGHRRGPAAGPGDRLQGDAGTFLPLFCVQTIVANAFMGPAGAGDLLDHRAERGDRASVQRRVPGDVVAPHDHAVHREERVELAGSKSVAAGGPDAAADPSDSGTRPV